MIGIISESGRVLKAIPWESGKVICYHRLFGFVSSDTFLDRQSNRLRHGYREDSKDFDFAFQLAGADESHFALEPSENCEVEEQNGIWILRGNQKTFRMQRVVSLESLPVEGSHSESDRPLWTAMILALFIPAAFLLLPNSRPTEEAPVVIEQVVVKIKQEAQRPVEVSSAFDHIPEIKKQDVVAKRAITQNLGFLGLLGRKDLKKAIGGVPTQLKDVSPGAGPGGKEGSGGELLVGLGKGLKRTTVGNTGVAGLGGIGTHGAGGGAGGYGNSAIGSGEGKALSTVPLSKELVLEGGLDRAVVQATIAKYLSQIRACYENGLKRNPALGGQVTMNFEIGGTGDMQSAKVERTSLDDQIVEECISQRMLGWKFPKPRGGVSVKVSYPFVLRSTKS